MILDRKITDAQLSSYGVVSAPDKLTGTAQENRKRANHALFVCYAPYEQPQIAIATRIAFGYASDYAAQVTKDIVKYYFKLEDESSLITGTAESTNVVQSAGD